MSIEFYNIIIKFSTGSERFNLKLLKQWIIKVIHLSIFKRKRKKKTRKKEKKKARKNQKKKEPKKKNKKELKKIKDKKE